MKTLLLFLSLIVATSQAATVRLYFTDPLTNDKDTNAFYITPIGTNVLSSGGVVGRGVTTRYVPASNGYRTNTLAVGHYSITNRSLGSGVVIRVPDSSSLYDYTNILISGYNIFVTITNGDSGTSGALTNNDTRAVTFDTSLTIGAGSAANSIHPSAGLLTFSNSILANGSYIKGHSIIGTNFVGNGASLTNLHGSNSITAGTIDTNRMDATAYAAFKNDVTQAGLAAGSYAINGALPSQAWVPNPSTKTAFYSDPQSRHWSAPDANSVLVMSDTNSGFSLNKNKNSTPSYAWIQYPFRAPLGSTQVLVSASFASVFATNTGMRFAYTTPSTAIALSETNFTVPASGFTNVQLTYNTTTSDLGLLFWPIYSASHNSAVTISNLTLTFLPAMTNAGLVGTWKRHDILNRYLQNDSVGTTRLQNSYQNAPANFQAKARLQFNTTATNLTVESVSTQSSWPFYVFTNGVICRGFAPSVRASEYWDVALSGLNNFVEIVYPISQVGTPQSGSFVRNIFTADNAQLAFYESKPDRKFWVFGDSIQIWGDGNAGLWSQIQRKLDVDYSLYAVGAGSLSNNWYFSKSNCIRSFVSSKATDAYIAHGFNDYYGAYWSTNMFATNYALLLDTLHAIRPDVTFYCQAPILSTTETANVLGHTLNDFRHVIAGVAQARTNFCIYIAGTNLVNSTGYLEDFAHPNEFGFAVYANALLPIFETAPLNELQTFANHYTAELGAVSRVSYGARNNTSTGFYFPSANVVGLAANGVDSQWWLGNDVYMSRNGFVFWASAFGGGVDTGLGNVSAGIVEVNSGTAGALRDIAVRTALTTNVMLYTSAQAAYVLPVASGVTMFSSNAFLYSIHNLAGAYTTNLIKAP